MEITWSYYLRNAVNGEECSGNQDEWEVVEEAGEKE